MNTVVTRVDRMIDEVFDEFFRAERENILSGVSERNLCGRLAIAISSKLAAHGFGHYYVDPEYNRKQNGEIKTILDDEFRVVRINCDLIVHTRGKAVECDNLIAFEMKKANRPEEEKTSDRNRLRALTKMSYDDVWSNDGRTFPEHVCGYLLGVYVEIDIDAGSCLVEYYRRGHRTETRQRNL